MLLQPPVSPTVGPMTDPWFVSLPFPLVELDPTGRIIAASSGHAPPGGTIPGTPWPAAARPRDLAGLEAILPGVAAHVAAIRAGQAGAGAPHLLRSALDGRSWDVTCWGPGPAQTIMVGCREILETGVCAAATARTHATFQALQAAHDHLVFRLHPTGVPWVSDLPRWIELTGADLASAEAGLWITHIHPQDQERVSLVFLEVLQTRTPHGVAGRVRQRTGAWHWYRGAFVPVIVDGTLDHVLVTLTDVDPERAEAARQQAEQQQQLRQVEAGHDRTKALLHAVGLTAFTLTPSGEVTDLSIGWASVTGHLLTLIDGAPLWAIAAEGTELEWQTFIHHVLTADPGDGPLQRRLLSRDAAGRERWLQFHVRPLGAGRGAEGVVRDVTAEVHLREARDAGHQRLQDLVEDIEACAWEIDETYQMRYCGPQITDILGRTPAEMCGTVPWRDWVSVADAERVGVAMAASQHPTRPQQRLDIQVQHRDGSFRLVRVRFRAILTAAGVCVGWRGVAEDVADEHTAAAQRLLREKLRAIETFSGGIAHELNNVLSSVLGAGEVLRSDPAVEADAELFSLAETLVLAAERGRSVIQRLLTFSRSARAQHQQGGVQPLLRRITPLGPTLASIMDRLAYRLPERVQLRVDPKLRSMLQGTQLESGELEAILAPLIDNAERALRGTDDPVIELRLDRLEGRRCVLAVADSGRGMSAEVRDRAIEPFFTTRPHGEGAGLGLSLVHGVLQTLGGEMALESVVGEGTTVRLTIPLAHLSHETPGEEALASASAVRLPGRAA